MTGGQSTGREQERRNKEKPIPTKTAKMLPYISTHATVLNWSGKVPWLKEFESSLTF